MIFERDINHENYASEVEYSYDHQKEIFRIFLSMDELYQITREALKASSETVKIVRPGS